MRTRLAGLALLLILASPAPAQEATEKVRDAEALLARGRVIEAIEALDDAAVALWQKAPLAFRRSLWVTEKAAGFGMYNPRPDAVFSAGQPMLVYAEPIGYGWFKNGDIYHVEILADVVFRGADGKELFRKDNFQKLELSGRVRNREFMVNFTYTLSGIPKGEYTVETTLRDQVTDKKGSFILPFTIR
ncbi:MAG TPA: hypothetical protein VHG27_10280 [Xanthobacteraceae bacterium]|nr:hypothetical protein [Xanthobacteraceae bacterium]